MPCALILCEKSSGWSGFVILNFPVSVVQISMPGMMDTVLNLGLNDEVVAGLASRSGERFAYDSYRRFIDMFGGVVSTEE